MTSSASWDRDIALEASAGEAVLSLGESPTTGYLWRLVDVPPEVEVERSEFVRAAGAMGAGGERRFTLRARSAGEFAFTAESARGDDPPAERVRVTLTVGPR